MDENPDGMINPLTPAPENTDPIEPLPEENLVQPTPVDSAMPEEPFAPVEPVASVEPASPSEPIIQQTFSQGVSEPVNQDISTTPVPPKKKTSLIISIILGVIAIGCAVAAILMFTVFKPTDGGSGNSGGSSTGGTDTPSTDTISAIDSCPGC